MEKYAKLLKGLEKCAGPECCKDGCPYYGETRGGMTCRARLLLDANIAITNEQGRADAAEMELQAATEELDEERLVNSDLEGRCDKLCEEAKWVRDELEKVIEGRRSVEAHLDAIDNDRADITRERDDLRIRLANLTEMRDKLVANNVELRKECDMTVTRCQVLQGEINALVLKLGKQEGETDRPSVSDDLAEQVGKLVAHANYQQGRADTLAEIVARCSFGGGCRHE